MSTKEIDVVAGMAKIGEGFDENPVKTRREIEAQEPIQLNRISIMTGYGADDLQATGYVVLEMGPKGGPSRYRMALPPDAALMVAQDMAKGASQAAAMERAVDSEDKKKGSVN